MKRRIVYNPPEYEECVNFVQWLRLRSIPHAHCANESQSGTRNAMIRGARLKRIGQSRGVFDYEVYVPKIQKDGSTKYKLLKIEMKRRKGGRVSAEQRRWQEIYEAAKIPCAICNGAGEAIEFVEKHL